MASKVCRKVLVSILVLLFLSGVGLCWALTQPRLVSNAALFFLKKSSSSVVFKEITIEKLKWESWKELNLQNVRVRFKVNKNSYFCSFGRIHLQDIDALLRSSKMALSLEHGVLVSDVLNASEIGIDSLVGFKGFKFQNASGSFGMLSFEADYYSFSPLRGSFKANSSQLDLFDVTAGFYNGDIQGKMHADFKTGPGYDISLQLNQIDLGELSLVNPSAFQEMKGRVNGFLFIKGSANDVQSLRAELKVPNGGHIPSNYLMTLAFALPKGNILRQPFDRALQDQKSIPFENSSVIVEMVGSEKYKALVNVLSTKAFVDFKYTYDINLEGGLEGLMKGLNLLHLTKESV